MDGENGVIRLHFYGMDKLERALARSIVAYLNLLSLIETHGYGRNDNTYYVKEEGRGVPGMTFIDGTTKEPEMVRKYE